MDHAKRLAPEAGVIIPTNFTPAPDENTCVIEYTH